MKSLEERKQEFIQKAKDKFGDKFDYSKVEYVNSGTKVCIICPEHGEFWQTPEKHLDNKYACHECARKVFGRGNKRYSKEKLIQKFIEIHGYKYLYNLENFKTVRDKITITCPEHGDYNQTVLEHLKGSGCPKCGLKRISEFHKDTLQIFMQKAICVHGNKYDYSNVRYINSITPVSITCKDHGDFYQKPVDHIRGNGCPRCLFKAQTRVYNKINSVFKNFIFEYSTEWLFPQRFDMYLKEYNIAIEYNGEQHYHPVKRFGGEEGYKICQERDKRKMEKCLQNNCKLFIVRYDHEEEDIRYIINEINKIVKNYEDN